MGYPIQVKHGESTLTINAEEGWSIPELKRAIEAETKVPVGEQKLTVGGRVMKEAKNLADFPAASKQHVNLISSAAQAKSPAKAGDGDKREQIDQIFSYIIKMVEENKQV